MTTSWGFIRLGSHAFALRVKHAKNICIRNDGVRPSGGDVFADTVVGGQALNAASILALNDMSKQFIALHVINKCAVNKVFAHVVPIHFFTE